MVARAAVLTAVACALLGASGCGEGEGAANGARVTAYVEAPLCAAAQRQLASEGARAGSLRVKAVCLPSPRTGARLSLATVGANARRASEDSAAIAYLGPLDPAAGRFSHPILDSAGIAWITDSSGAIAMGRLLDAVREADPTSLRESVRGSLRED
jgi:hypothetical protein